jgi:hypothetical protein
MLTGAGAGGGRSYGDPGGGGWRLFASSGFMPFEVRLPGVTGLPPSRSCPKVGP